MTKCSLILSTYNWPQALDLCLTSISRQSVLPGEVIIADDGSGQETRDIIEGFKIVCPVPVHHVWHADEGFQLAKIRNRAIAKTSCAYIIQIDGDLILHRHFIKDHLDVSQQDHFVTGSRFLLSPETTKHLFEHRSIDIGKYNKNGKNFLNRFRNAFFRKQLSHRYKVSGKNKFYVKGCNMAFWKKDLVAVNGYNESFTGWGKEDNEIAIRLINAGVKKKFLKMGGIAYHLYHNEAPRAMHQRNIALMEEAITSNRTLAQDGLDKYL